MTSITHSEKIAFVRSYFERLTLSDIDGIIGMFESDADVVSPFLGTMPVADFFAKLGSASRQNRLTVFDVLMDEAGDSAAAHFEYDWTLANGTRVVFQGIDYFRFGPSGKFASLAIFYDTHPVRADVGDKYAGS